MSAEPSPAPLFVANRFKGLDYVFEITTRLELMRNLLALPTPSFPGCSDSFPHDGWLPDAAYRTPWTRGNVISTSKFFLKGSVSEDLKGTQVDLLERWCPLTPSCLTVHGFTLQVNPCQESFTKSTSEEVKPQKEIKDFLLQEDLMAVDYLPHFTRHLPTLKAKLSRLKTLPVTDPLGSLTGAAVSVETTFRLCASYQTPSGAISEGGVHTSADTREQFGKARLISGQSLELPCVVDSVEMNVKQEHLTAFSTIVSSMNVFPEVLEELPGLSDVLHADVSQSLEISRYEVPEGLCEKNSNHLDPELAGHATPLTEKELDVPLTPQSSQSRDIIPTCELQKEELSPLTGRPLLRVEVQTKMEAALWMAEKHPFNLASFLLAEPQIGEPAVCFQPLPEALAILELDKHIRLCDGEDLQSKMEMESLLVVLCNNRDLTEHIVSEMPLRKNHQTEDFKRLSPGHVHEKSVQTNKFKDALQQIKKVTPETRKRIAPAVKAKDRVSAPSAGETNTCLEMQRELVPQHAASSREHFSEDHDRSLLAKRCPPVVEPDPLGSFLMLRAQQASPVKAANQSSSGPPAPLAAQRELQPSPELTQMSKWKTKQVMSSVAVKSNSEEQKVSFESPARLVCQPVSGDSRKLEVEATASQRRAYAELLSVAQRCSISVRRLHLKLPAGGDFDRLDPEQTRFLIKQQEKALSRARAESAERYRELELLFNQVTVIHVLVTVKELLLQCSLRTALDYLSQRVESSTEQTLQQLLKRLQIIFHISQRNPEGDLKLLELQRQLSEWLHGSKPSTSRVLVLLAVDCESSRAAVVNGLRQVAGAAVTAVSPEEGEKKLNGASLVRSVQGSVCMVACEQHVGPDFPWSCFSLVVELDRPGQSPWAEVCKERSLAHLWFRTAITGSEEEEEGVWRLEDHVPYVLFVTEGLLNSPLLLQTLESGFGVTVLERSHSPSLHMLGGTHHYAVITVDEKTAVIIQKDEELCQPRASEALVMRLNALSLQYSCCWLLLYCPDSQGGGFSGEAFSNLALVYSSAVLFGLKPEDLNVKVLIVSEMQDVARWISQICFHSLMNSDGDPLDFLDRDWLAVIPSEEERCLSQFPSINPLVGQLMLRRAPSLPWLLGAPASQLAELLPGVPHKVLKHFSDITSLYTSSKGTDQPEFCTPVAVATEHTDPLSSLWIAATDAWPVDHQPQPEARLSGFRPDLGSPFGGADSHLQRSFMDDDGREAWKFGDLGGRAVVLGGVAERVMERGRQAAPESPQSLFPLDSIFGSSPVQERHTFPWCPDNLHSSFTLSPPAWFTPSGRSSGGEAAVSASYGSRFWMGQEQKRGSGAVVLDPGEDSMMVPSKRSRLSCERIPGRSDGQTRLKLKLF